MFVQVTTGKLESVKPISKFVLVVPADRDHTHHVKNIYLEIAMIVIMSFFVFKIPIADIAARMSISSELFLVRAHELYFDAHTRTGSTIFHLHLQKGLTVELIQISFAAPVQKMMSLLYFRVAMLGPWTGCFFAGGCVCSIRFWWPSNLHFRILSQRSVALWRATHTLCSKFAACGRNAIKQKG